MIRSMTGYGGAKGTVEGLSVTVELKSVNNRYLDIAVRMPRNFLFAEDAVKSTIQQHVSRGKLDVPDMGDAFTRKLYATYLSYLPTDGFSYPLDMHCDARGSFTEFLRTPERGQVSVNISRPGVVKGNHWHHTKNEKFLVVKGEGVIRFRRLNTEAVYEYRVSGDKLVVVDIPTGYTHNIENVGESDMVTEMWASEPFDPERPDTYFLEV